LQAVLHQEGFKKPVTAVWALLHHGECFDEERFARG
jgi:hypothetical protein